jgi:hypothetical protein
VENSAEFWKPTAGKCVGNGTPCLCESERAGFEAKMAHIQQRGVRISGQRTQIALGQSMNLELWGPYRETSGEFLLVTSDWSAVQVIPGSMDSVHNVRSYKLTAKEFSSQIEVDLIDGELLDDAGNYDAANLKNPYIACDRVFITVVPASGNIAWPDYFAEVIPAIASGLAEYNSSHAVQLVDKAGFLLVQTYNEQSPGKTGKPSKHGNRMFNVQALVTRPKGVMTVVPGQEEDGVTIRNLSQGEGPTDATRTDLTSPTFYYDTPVRAVTHYLKVLEHRYKPAYAVITDPTGSFGPFADALRAVGYATDKAYASKMKGTVAQVLGQGKAWTDYEVKGLDHDIASSVHASEAESLKRKRALLVDFLEQLKRFKN